MKKKKNHLAKGILPEDSPRIKKLKARQLELRTRRFKAERWGLDRYADVLYKRLLEIESGQLN